MVIFDLILFILLITALTGVGCKIFSFCKIRFFSWEEKVAYSLGLGAGVISILFLLLGAAQLYHRTTAYVVLILLLLISWREIYKLIQPLWQRMKNIKVYLKKVPVYIWLIIGVLILHIVLNLIAAMGPPGHADTLYAHFGFPKQFIQLGGIQYIPYDFYSNYPLGLNMLYVFGMLLRSDILASLVSFGFSLFILLVIFAFCKRYVPQKYQFFGLIAGVIFYAAPMTTLRATSGMLELGLCLYVILAFFSIYNWLASKDLKWLIVGAVFAGFGAGVKLSGLLFAPILVGFIFIFCLFVDKSGLKRIIKIIFIFTIIFIVVASPWYLKNYFLTGNPVYPVFYSILGGRDLNLEVAQALQSAVSVEHSFSSFFKSFWTTTMDASGHAADTDPISPLFLIFLPLLFFVKNKKKYKFIFYILFFSLAYYLLWFFFLLHAARRLIYLLPLLSILVTIVIFELIKRRGRVLKYVIVSCLAVTFLFSLVTASLYTWQFVPVVFGLQAKEVLLKKTWFYDDIVWANKHIPKSSKVLTFNRINYYREHDFLLHYTYSRIYWPIDYKKMEFPEQVLKRYQELGITHVFESDLRDKSEVYLEFRDKYLEKIYENKVYPILHRTLSIPGGEENVALYQVIYPDDL